MEKDKAKIAIIYSMGWWESGKQIIDAWNS